LAIAQRLEDAGFYVPAIRPPTVPAAKARLRITLSAAHSEADVAQLLDALAQAAFTASSNELARLRMLSGQGNASTRALQTVEAAASRDQLLIQSIRDEAHRFAVTFHRKRRQMRDRSTELLEIPGVGASTTRRLLEHFGSVQAVKQADAAALSAVVTRAQAEAILGHFRR
jgi:2C-methyl-D-erythritol 2,4-cyclodiphosphate synthase